MPDNIDRYKKELDFIEAGSRFKSDVKAKLLLELAAQNSPPAQPDPARQASAAPAVEEAPGQGQTDAPAPEAEPAQPGAPKKASTIRFPRRMRAAAAAIALTLVGMGAVWVYTSQNQPVADTMAGLYESPAAAYAEEAFDDAADGGEAVEEEAAMEAADTADEAHSTTDGALGGYFANDGTLRGILPVIPESFTVGEMESLDEGYQAVKLYGFREYGGVLLGEDGIPGTLPVFRNTAQRGTSDATLEDKAAALEAIGYELMDSLGLSLKSVGHHEQSTISYVELGCDGASIQVYADESVSIWFDEPQQVVTGAVSGQSEPAKWEEVAEATVEQYPMLFAGMRQPRVEVLHERDLDGDATWYITVYDGGGTLAETVQSRSLRYARLLYDGTGRLRGVMLNRKDTEPLGRYSTITLEEATEALAAGHSVTTVPYEFPGRRYIAGVDLVYLATGYEESYLPFYLFYVDLAAVEQLPEDADEDLATYGMWYVPALAGEHVKDADGLPFFGEPS